MPSSRTPVNQPAPSSAESRALPSTLTAGVLLFVLALAAIALAGLGSRWGWWTFRTGFVILKWGSYAVLASALVTLVAAFLTRGASRSRALVLAGVVTVVALATVAVPWKWQRTARAVPRIHDITTDTENPPEFVALHDQRPGALNPVEYGGPEIAAQQRAGYPDIAPAMLAIPPREAVERTVAIARDLGWEVVAVDSAAGRVEATDRTRWFGFYDDVVVRVAPAGTGSRVDVRSLSRVGGSDVGMNARRIRSFMKRLQREE